MKLKLPNTRLAFPDLFVPRAFQEGDELKYGATFLIPNSSPLIKEVNAAILKVATEKWGGKAKGVLESIKSNPNKYCFQSGEIKPDYDGYADHHYIAAKSAKRPLILDRDKTVLTAADGRPYAGCYVNGIIEIWAQDNKWGKGMRSTLGGVQFYKDGEAFTGGDAIGEDEFEEFPDGDSDSDLA